MKRSVVILFVLHIAIVKAIEYSVEERLYIVETLLSEEHHNQHQLQNNPIKQELQYTHKINQHQQVQHINQAKPHNLNHQPKQHHHQFPDNHQQHQSPQQQQHLQYQHQQLYNEEQPRSVADGRSMQQVLLHTSSQPYHRVAHTQIEWKHESADGELDAIYMDNFESSYSVMSHDQLAYYQYHHVQHQQHHIQPHHQHHYDEIIAPTFNRPLQSCDSQNPSMLMQNNLEEPQTCNAKQSSTATSPGSTSGNVPNFSHLNNHNSNVDSFPLSQQQLHYESSLMGAIRHYWREVSCLCLTSAIFLNWLFVVVKRRFVRAEHAINEINQAATKSISKDTNSSSAHDSAFEETSSPLNLEENDSLSDNDHADKSTESGHISSTSLNIRQRSSTLKAEPIPIPSSPGHKSQSNSLSNSLSNFEYNSRYSSDFDSIQRLGRGGFGIVFEARNKIDDCHYAVKRICLPLEKEARERVMREVRALAKLDHAGIVRYYNAWLETPPDDWLKQHDAQLGILNSKDGLGYPSTDGIYERNESEQAARGGERGKMGESGDNSSSLFSSSPFKKRKNGFRKYLKNNSSSPSLDIVFEGSGSIRLESENNTEKTNSYNEHTGHINDNLQERNIGDNNSDSEDSDFIKFESKSKDGLTDIMNEISITSPLTDPFSSTSSDDATDSEADVFSLKNNTEKKPLDKERRKALKYQKELRQLNNTSLVENLHVEKVYLYIQMQLCRKDTLKDWLKTNCEQRDKTTIFDLFYQIVDAVEYVHSQDLIHRDLKPSNIFFSLDGTLKIGDFGLCRAKTSAGIGSSLDLQEYVAESDVERGFEAVHTEQVGTQLYMSPEQLNGLSYNQKVDIFAMGLILLELLLPFKTQMQRVNVLFKARNNLFTDEFRNEHPQEHELVRSLLSRSPLKRPTATEIKQHNLLASAQLSQPVIERIYHRRRTISSNSTE